MCVVCALYNNNTFNILLDAAINVHCKIIAFGKVLALGKHLAYIIFYSIGRYTNLLGVV